mmetsp:Transcript_7015/g.11062  ORF Transcript_7015/g.11062 Transcript_7015/m.11062 type:complete len:529 (+) Transcript_7015:170-1756(+)
MVYNEFITLSMFDTIHCCLPTIHYTLPKSQLETIDDKSIGLTPDWMWEYDAMYDEPMELNVRLSRAVRKNDTNTALLIWQKLEQDEKDNTMARSVRSYNAMLQLHYNHWNDDLFQDLYSYATHRLRPEKERGDSNTYTLMLCDCLRRNKTKELWDTYAKMMTLMKLPSAVMWGKLIEHRCKHNQHEEALHLLEEMRIHEVPPTNATLQLLAREIYTKNRTNHLYPFWMACGRLCLGGLRIHTDLLRSMIDAGLRLGFDEQSQILLDFYNGDLHAIASRFRMDEIRSSIYNQEKRKRERKFNLEIKYSGADTVEDIIQRAESYYERPLAKIQKRNKSQLISVPNEMLKPKNMMTNYLRFAHPPGIVRTNGSIQLPSSSSSISPNHPPGAFFRRPQHHQHQHQQQQQSLMENYYRQLPTHMNPQIYNLPAGASSSSYLANQNPNAFLPTPHYVHQVMAAPPRGSYEPLPVSPIFDSGFSEMAPIPYIPESRSLLEERPLPPEWSEHVSEKGGTVYYYNKITRQSTWTRPV